MRTIRDHSIFGKAYIVNAVSEEDAENQVRNKYRKQVWESKQLSDDKWEVYAANPEDCFALND